MLLHEWQYLYFIIFLWLLSTVAILFVFFSPSSVLKCDTSITACLDTESTAVEICNWSLSKLQSGKYLNTVLYVTQRSHSLRHGKQWACFMCSVETSSWQQISTSYAPFVDPSTAGITSHRKVHEELQFGNYWPLMQLPLPWSQEKGYVGKATFFLLPNTSLFLPLDLPPTSPYHFLQFLST